MLPAGRGSTYMAKEMPIIKTISAPLSSPSPKKSTKKLSWRTGFLTPQKTVPPKEQHESPPPSSKCPSRAMPTVVLQVCCPTTQASTSLTMPVNKKKPINHRNFSQRYNLRVCLDGAQVQAFSKWEAISTLLLQLHAIDQHIQLYPWQCQDNTMYPPINLAAISDNTFFDLHVFVPWLASQQEGWRASIASGRTQHPYIWLKSLVSPSSLVAQLSPWLRATKQGMWIQQLPLAEQTVCLG